MSHIHPMKDSDLSFKIDPITRQIINRSEKIVLMQRDHNSEIFTFEMPRYIDGHDMSLCDTVEIFYVNAGRKTKHEGLYLVRDYGISDTDDRYIKFSWTISGGCTSIEGILCFNVRFTCTDLEHDTVGYIWFSSVYKDINICKTIYDPDIFEEIEEEYADLFAEWNAKIEYITSLAHTHPNKDILDQITSLPLDGKNAYPIVSASTVNDLNNIRIAISSGDYSSDKAFVILETNIKAGLVEFKKGDLLEITSSTIKVLFNMQGGGGSLEDYYTKEETDALISPITEKLPPQASSTNQLADKEFVNSSINNIAAFPISKDASGNPFTTKAELDAATVFYSGGEVRVPTRNDYTVVLSDESHTDPVTGNTPTTRYYYYNGWNYQYPVNNTGFTAAQWAAVNSGITAALVASIGNKVDKMAGYGLSEKNFSAANLEKLYGTFCVFSSVLNFPSIEGAYPFLWMGADGTEFTYTDYITSIRTTVTLNYGEFWAMSVWGAGLGARQYVFTKLNFELDIPLSLAELLPDENHRTVTDAQIANWNDKLFAFNDTDDFKRLDATEARFFIWNADEEDFTYTGTDGVERTTTFDFGEVWTGTYNGTLDHYYFSKIGNINEIADITDKESTSNKVTSISASSTDMEYPSAKCVYDLVGNVETLLGGLISGGGVE